MSDVLHAPAYLDALAEHFGFSYRVAKRNLHGITHEQSLVAPQPGGNNIAWIVRHLVTTRDRVLPSLGAGVALAGPADALRLEDLVSAFDVQQERLVRAIGMLDEERLHADAPFSPTGGPLDPMHRFLNTCAFHEAYHVGQIGILRRFLGLEGVL